MTFLRLVAVGAVLLFHSVGLVQAADPVKIRVAWIAAPTNLTPILFAKDGIAKHLGKSYTLETVRFNSTSHMITAIATDDLDIGGVAGVGNHPLEGADGIEYAVGECLEGLCRR